jgi:hypothetical protein
VPGLVETRCERDTVSQLSSGLAGPRYRPNDETAAARHTEGGTLTYNSYHPRKKGKHNKDTALGILIVLLKAGLH